MRSLTVSELEVVVGGEGKPTPPRDKPDGKPDDSGRPEREPVPSWNDTTHYVEDSEGRYHFSPEWQAKVDKGWGIDGWGVVRDLFSIGVGAMLGAGEITLKTAIAATGALGNEALDVLEEKKE